MDMAESQKLASRFGTPLLVLSRARLRESYRNFKKCFPQIQTYFAVKSNAEKDILSTLELEGCNFDVCTIGEINAVSRCGISPERCVHTHPIKRDSDIRYALDFGIKLFVVDNEHELRKFSAYKDRVNLLVRISIQNSQCLVDLSYKYGIEPDKALDLIFKAQEMGLNVQGICFHVGSQSENPQKYIEALEYCRKICMKVALSGKPLEIVDIGGGFPIDYWNKVLSLEQFSRPINEYLERWFPSYRIIAEPGRFISGPCMSLIAKVIGKSLRNGVRWYYLDEGVYGSFSGKMFDHAVYPFALSRTGEKFNSILAGPTCDSIDVLYENVMLPELEINDLMFFESMGAYTCASATNFNGFPKARIIAVD